MNLLSLLIGMVLTTFIVTAGIEWYGVVKHIHQRQKEFFSAVEILHTSFQFLANDLRSAGFRGCRSNDLSFPLRKNYDVSEIKYQNFRFDRTLYGFSATFANCYGKLDATLCEKIKENSDVLILYNVPKKVTALSERMTAATDAIVLKEKPDIWQDSLVLISDCLQGDLFIATHIDRNRIMHHNIIRMNQSDSLSKAYGLEASVVELQTVVYYLALSESINKNKGGKEFHYGLYRKDFLHRAEEIVSGVSSLKFEYGLWNEKSSVIEYKSAENLTENDFTRVTSVRVRITTEKDKDWSYEVWIRNRYGLNRCFDAISWPIAHRAALC